MPQDEPLSLVEPPKIVESSSRKRISPKTFFTLLAFGIPVAILFALEGYSPAGFQIATMAAYTLAIPYFASNRFFDSVPWDRLTRRRVLIAHCLALVVVYGLTSVALAIKPRLPGWFIVENRGGSFFDLCLFGILFALAFSEYGWVMRQKGEHQLHR